MPKEQRIPAGTSKKGACPQEKPSKSYEKLWPGRANTPASEVNP